jgi:hypothetical protein
MVESNSNEIKKFNYSSVQKHQSGGKKTLKKVVIKKGKGHKSVSYYKKGKMIKTIKKPIHNDHIILIYQKQFIPGLFSDCQMKSAKSKSKTKKIRLH